MRFDCITNGHLYLRGLDRCARCHEKKRPEDEPEQDYDQDGYTW